ncbi:MAG: ABC transporter permease [Gemmataceae bacterium]
MMSYALATLWHERQRYLPGVLAVGFSALLIALQCGLLIGLFSITSIPVDNNKADVWMGSPAVSSVDLGRPIREGYLARMASHPGIAHTEVYLQGFAYWNDRAGQGQLCMVIGSRLEPMVPADGPNQGEVGGSLGAVKQLSNELRGLLAEPGTIVIDKTDKKRLKISDVGDTAEVMGTKVRVVGFTDGLRSLAGPYVFCSVTTARRLLRLQPDQVTYILGKCQPGHDPTEVAREIQQRYVNDDAQTADDPWYAEAARWVCGVLGIPYGDPPPSSVTVYSAREFSRRSQWYWLTRVKAGIALGYAAALGLLVGAVVTSQTLYAATAASLREYAVLRAMGIPRWRMSMMVITQAFFVGVIGIILAVPTAFALKALAERAGLQINLNAYLLLAAAGVTLTMALGSGLMALRSLRDVEPATLLR